MNAPHSGPVQERQATDLAFDPPGTPSSGRESHLYQEWFAWWNAFALRLMGAKGSSWRAVAVCFGALIIINACPLNPFRPALAGPGQVGVVGEAGYAKKLREPFADIAISADPMSHESKLNYRLAVPLLCKPFGLDLRGLRFVGFGLALASIAMLLGLFERLIGDRVAAFWWTLMFCGLPASARLVHDNYPFDGFAVFFGVASICCRNPLLVGLAAFAGAWTDERCLAASAWAIVFHAAMGFRTKQPRHGWCAASVPLAWLAYVGTRWWVWKATGITLAIGGVNATRWITHMGMIPVGSFLALESGCLALLAFLLPMLVKKTHRLYGLTLLGGLIASILLCALVIDFTRSLNPFWIALPTTLAVALWRMPELWSPVRLRQMGMVLAVTCLLFPSTECYFLNVPITKGAKDGAVAHLYMFKSLPLRLGAWLAGVKQGEHP